MRLFGYVLFWEKEFCFLQIGKRTKNNLLYLSSIIVVCAFIAIGDKQVELYDFNTMI